MIASRVLCTVLVLTVLGFAMAGQERLRSKVNSMTPAGSEDVIAQLQQQLQQGLAEQKSELSAFQPGVQAAAANPTPATGASLVNFLQQQQQQYQEHQTALQQEAQNPAAAAHGAEQSLKDMILMQQQMSARNAAENKAVATVGGAVATRGAATAKGGDFTPCHTCVFVLERIKKGNNMLLPAICSEVYKEWPESYSDCHQVLNALTYNGNNVRYWLFEGCFKYEVYRAKEWIKPCPSHVMCSVLKNLDGEPFCQALPMEDPFA